MAPIHSRIPAVLRLDEVLGFLDGGLWTFLPYDGALVVTPFESPLKSAGGAAQRELF